MISNVFKQRGSYEPDSKNPSVFHDEAMAAGQSKSKRLAGKKTGSNRVKQTRVIHKRKLQLPSPMMLTKLYKKHYQKYLKQGFVMRQKFIGRRPKLKEKFLYKEIACLIFS